MPSARTCGVLVIVMFCATSAAAQSAHGHIQGSVADMSGVLLPGVTVTITHTAAGTARETMTDDAGFFAAPVLPVGSYDVQASLQGYATQRQPGVSVLPGRVITLRLELGVAPAPETITIAGRPPMIETTQSHVASNVGAAELQHLPARDHDAIAFALLAPGVTGGVRSAVPGGDISVAGQPSWLNRITRDGVDRERPFGGAGRVSVDAVEDVQVNISAYPAEYGRAGGGIIGLATRSGSNQIGGSVVQYFGDTELSAAAGAPIVRDEHFVFGHYNARRVGTRNDVFLNLPPDTPSDAGTRAALDRLRPRAVPWDRTQDSDLVLFKTDHRLSDDQHLSLRYDHEDFNARGLDFGPNVTPEAASFVDGSERALTALSSSVIGTTLFNEARIHVGRSREGSDPNTDVFAAIRQGGTEVLRIGHDVVGARDARVTRVQFGDALTWVRGAHTLKTGLDVRLDNVVSRAAGHFAGSYTFGSLAAFNRGMPSAIGDAYVQTFEDPGTSGRTTHPDVSDYSLFAQNEWRMDDTLTLNLGVRYDVQTFAQPDASNPDPQLAAAGLTTSIASDRNNLGPRLGIAWAPMGSSFLVRGGYGIVYGRTPWTMAAAAQANNGINVQTIAFRGAAGDPVPAFPNRFSRMPARAGLRPIVMVFEPDYQSARVQQAAGGFEWEWMPDTTLSANYIVARGDHLPRAVELNVAGRPFTSFARVIAYESAAQSRYQGVTIELARRFTQGYHYRLAYTLGRVEDTMPDVGVLVPESLDDRKVASDGSRAARAPGDRDHRHRFVATAIQATNRWSERYDGLMRALTRDWTLSVVYTAQTGAPHSAYVSGDMNADNNRFNDLAPGTTRNQFRLPGSMSLDTRFARDVELKGTMRVAFIWEVINLLNRSNSGLVNDTLYDLAGTELRPNLLFGQVLEAPERRTMLAAVRFSF